MTPPPEGIPSPVTAPPSKLNRARPPRSLGLLVVRVDGHGDELEHIEQLGRGRFRCLDDPVELRMIPIGGADVGRAEVWFWRHGTSKLRRQVDDGIGDVIDMRGKRRRKQAAEG